MQGLNRRNWRGRRLGRRRKEELDGKWEGERHSPGMEGVATGARVGWRMAGGFEDEVAIAGEEAGPAMEKKRRLENGRIKKKKK